MLYSVDHLRGWRIHATDGELGTVDDLLFDDEHWTIRYVVVNTGSWLTGRLVLIPPPSLKALHADTRALDVALTRQQVQNSPDIDTNQPVSRQQEEEIYRHYEYPVYWENPVTWGPNMAPASAIIEPPTEVASFIDQGKQGDQHLRSTHDVKGYAIHARDDEIGHVSDFLVDDATWALRYVIVNTGNWFSGKQVLLSSEWITGVSWAIRAVQVDLLRDTIKNSPAYDSSHPFSRAEETALYQYYQQRPYWEQQANT